VKRSAVHAMLEGIQPWLDARPIRGVHGGGVANVHIRQIHRASPRLAAP